MNTRGALLRILDANTNRAAEGLRVVEDILRFGLDHARLSGEARSLRHRVARIAGILASRQARLAFRDSRRDVGAGRWRTGTARRTIADTLVANFRRTQESLRVIEECARLAGNASVSSTGQRLRYHSYELERRIMRLRILLHSR